MAKSLKCGRFQNKVIFSKKKIIIILSYLLKLITYFFERFFKEKCVYVYAYFYVNIWDEVVRSNKVISKFIFLFEFCSLQMFFFTFFWIRVLSKKCLFLKEIRTKNNLYKCTKIFFWITFVWNSFFFQKLFCNLNFPNLTYTSLT
jgi:hypothetical protein